MSELVIVIADLLLGELAQEPAARAPLAGIESFARLGAASPLERTWREWAAHWLGLQRYADCAPASIAAAATEPPPGETLWLAEPLHLTEGIGRLYLERRGRLRLGAASCARLAADFNALYAGSGWALAPLPDGTLLLGAPAGGAVESCDPARLPAGALEQCLPRGPGAAPLRRLGAELEMWLHAHPLNAERLGRGEPPVSQLWIWGGGAAAAAPRPGPAATGAVSGTEAYLEGLARLGAAAHGASAPEWPYGPAGAPGRALHVLEVGEELRRAPGADLHEALLELDRCWIAPAVAALAAGRLERLWLLANGRAWALRPRDRWRFWRRGRAGLQGLA